MKVPGTWGSFDLDAGARRTLQGAASVARHDAAVWMLRAKRDEAVDTSVQAAVPFYGVYDFTDRQRLDPKLSFQRFAERIVIKKKFADDPGAFERASPMSRVRADAPPFFVIHGALDSLVPVRDAQHFAALLRAASQAPVCYAELAHAQHAFEVFHSLRTRNIVRGVDRFLAFAYAAWLAR